MTTISPAAHSIESLIDSPGRLRTGDRRSNSNHPDAHTDCLLRFPNQPHCGGKNPQAQRRPQPPQCHRPHVQQPVSDDRQEIDERRHPSVRIPA